MIKLSSLLVAGMFEKTTVCHNGKWTPTYEKRVDPRATALQNLLRDGQCLVDDLFHNASWYNKLGEKLGWGDVSREQLQQLPKVMPAGEVLVLCPESASFWDLRGTDIDPARPGVEFLIKNAAMVITPQGLYVPPGKYDDADRWEHMSKLFFRGAVDTHRVNQEWFRNLMTTAGQTMCNVEERLVVCPIDHPPLVEELLPSPWTVGDNWTCSQPDQKLPDGRWALRIYDATTPEPAVEDFSMSDEIHMAADEPSDVEMLNMLNLDGFPHTYPESEEEFEFDGVQFLVVGSVTETRAGVQSEVGGKVKAKFSCRYEKVEVFLLKGEDWEETPLSGEALADWLQRYGERAASETTERIMDRACTAAEERRER